MADKTTTPASTEKQNTSFGPIQLGENGHLEYSWVNVFQEKVLQLSFQLTRTRCEYQKKVLRQKYSELLNDAFYSPIITQEKRSMHISILYRLMLHTRDMINGKGEYDLFYLLLGEWVKLGNQRLTQESDMINKLADKALLSAIALDGHDHAYGSWKDMKYFLHYLYKIDGITGPRRKLPIFNTAIKCIVSQLKKDATAETPSLLAKWIPREKSKKFGWLAKYIACMYYSEWFVNDLDLENPLDPHYDSNCAAGRKCLTHYRKLIARLNKKLNTVQINQCNGEWRKIDFEKSITSRTLFTQGRAFEYLNHYGAPRGINIDRLQCSENYKAYIQKCYEGKATIKHAHTGIMELVRAADEYIRNKNIPSDKNADDNTHRDMINLQWEESGNLIDNFETSTLKNCIAMIDTSGSMRENNSDAFYAAIALGCRIAENSALGKRAMSFSNTPEWIDLSKAETLTEMVETIQNDNTWGMNTNFEVALKRILDACIETDMTPYEVKNLRLVILSDMQIDFADTKATSLHHLIEKMFEEGGMRTSHKQPYKPPHIVYWNLRSTSGFPTLSFMPNVSMVSGFSQTILNIFCEKGSEAIQCCTPWVMLNEQLNHPRYQWANNTIHSMAVISGWITDPDKDTDIIPDIVEKSSCKKSRWLGIW
tara:strand:+ start:18060 stop:20015 length:1956 start_codon:yes stop_codon:yes gene_type:complete